MSVKGFKSHPYIPNSVPEVEQEMLHEIGLNSLEELHEEVPDEIILKGEMNLPKAFGSEYELRRHVEKLLKKNSSCDDNLNFLGAGCYQHYVPAICDEINGKGEFLTAYGGESYNDFGRFQTLFEYESLMAELVDMEVVNVPHDGLLPSRRHRHSHGFPRGQAHRRPRPRLDGPREARRHQELLHARPCD